MLCSAVSVSRSVSLGTTSEEYNISSIYVAFYVVLCIMSNVEMTYSIWEDCIVYMQYYFLFKDFLNYQYSLIFTKILEMVHHRQEGGNSAASRKHLPGLCPQGSRYELVINK